MFFPKIKEPLASASGANNNGHLARKLRVNVMGMRSTWTSEEEDIECLRELGELLDAADAHLLSMEAARYESTRAQAKDIIRRHAFNPQLEGWCEDAWALIDIFEEVLTELELQSARIIELRAYRL